MLCSEDGSTPAETGGRVISVPVIDVSVEVVVPECVSSECVVAVGGCISDTFLCGEGGLDIGGEGYDGMGCHGGDPPCAKARSERSI